MKILLISANRLAHPHPVYPLGLDYLAAALSESCEVRRADLLSPSDALHPLEVAERFCPDVVGVSLRNIDNTDAMDPHAFIEGYRVLVSGVRERCSGVIVVGGAGFTIAPEAILEQVGADLGLLGEGERMAQLVDSLAQGGDAREVPGVLYPGETAVMPSPLEVLPGRRLPADPAALAPYLARGGILNLQTKRGCPYHCSYCTYPHLEGHRIRRADPVEVAEAALALQGAGARFLFMTDAAFNADEEHGVAVAEAMLRAGVRTPWGAFFAPRTSDPGYFSTLARAGLTHVEFGTESLVPRVLAALGKPFSPDSVHESHQAALRAGLHIAHYFMLGGPSEDEGSLRATFAAARRLRRCVCFFFAGVRVFPGTALHEMARAEGQISGDTDPLVPIFYAPPGLSMERLHSVIAEEVRGESRFYIGAGGSRIARVVDKMYDLGYSGPLWERLIS